MPVLIIKLDIRETATYVAHQQSTMIIMPAESKFLEVNVSFR